MWGRYGGQKSFQSTAVGRRIGGITRGSPARREAGGSNDPQNPYCESGWRPEATPGQQGAARKTIATKQLSSIAPWRPESGRCLVLPSAASWVLKDLWISGQLAVKGPSIWSPSSHQWVAGRELDGPTRGKDGSQEGSHFLSTRACC